MQGRALTSLLLILLATGLALAENPQGDSPIIIIVNPQVPTANPPIDESPAPVVEPQVPAPAPPVEEAPSSGRFWVDGEALFWWTKGANLPPLVTASPPGSARSTVGVLGIPGTSAVFGGSPVNDELNVGGRLTAGLWLDCDRTFGVEGYFFQLDSQAHVFSGGSPAILGRPFVNTVTGRTDAELVSFPGFLDGKVQASASSGNLLGAGALGRANFCCGCGYRLDALAGYRYLCMSDRVGINENLTSTDVTQAVVPLGTNIILADGFHTINQFHGGDVGLAGEFSWGSWTLGSTASVALGSTHERADVNGVTVVTVPGFPPTVHPGGLLALSSNSGTHTRDILAVVPEVRVQAAYDFGPHLSVHAGYSFLYWSQVVRAGDQIDRAVNPALLPPPLPGASPLRPAFTFQGSGFWAQGIDLGVEIRF